MHSELILPLSPVPPIPFFSQAAFAEKTIVDGEENYVKQTVRNRYFILGSNGVLCLTIPVVGQQGKKVRTKDIEIDYSKPWLRLHLRSLEAAYRSAPFYDHYIDPITKILSTPHNNLSDFFTASFPAWLALLRLDLPWEMSKEYLELRNSFDLRETIKSPDRFPAWIHAHRYEQVFSDRFPFKPHLSVPDLLFNEGPAAARILLA